MNSSIYSLSTNYRSESRTFIPNSDMLIGRNQTYNFKIAGSYSEGTKFSLLFEIEEEYNFDTFVQQLDENPDLKDKYIISKK